MDFRRLETFVRIAKHQSFTKAAEELYLTQPTLSGHIQALEERMGVILFNRCGKQVTLTDAGRIMYNYAVNLLNLREQALYSLARYKGQLEGELVIAASTIPQNYLLPGLLTALNRRYPAIRYTIRQFDSGGVMGAIISGDMDFGFVGVDTSFPELEMYKLCEDRLILITPGGDCLEGSEGQSVTWAQIKDKRFILRERGSGTGKLFLKGLKEKGVELGDLQVIAQVENPDTIKQFVQQGLGVAVVSEMSVKTEIQLGQLRAYHISDLDLERSFYFISHKNRVFSPVTRAFKEFTQEFFPAPAESCR